MPRRRREAPHPPGAKAPREVPLWLSSPRSLMEKYETLVRKYAALQDRRRDALATGIAVVREGRVAARTRRFREFEARDERWRRVDGDRAARATLEDVILHAAAALPRAARASLVERHRQLGGGPTVDVRVERIAPARDGSMIATVVDVTDAPPEIATSTATGARRRRAEVELRELRQRAVRENIVREDEKTRIAQELHDEMGQLLTALRIDLDALEEALSARPVEGPIPTPLDRAVDASELVAQLVDALRRVVTALRPAALDRLGLCPALHEECRRFEVRTGVRCAARIPEAPSGFGPEIDTALFRVAQEALTNVARHAGASAVSVAIDADERVVSLRVEDDGRGIDLTSVGASSLGIVGMRERVERLAGELRVVRGARRGTVVTATLPLARATAPAGPVDRGRA